jgi:hypothetical protein
VLSFIRKNPDNGESLLVVLNMSNKSKTVAFNLNPQGITGNSGKPVLAYPKTSALDVPLDAITLAPFATLVAAVK